MRCHFPIAVVTFLCGVSSALAQTAPPPHLSVLEGSADILRGVDRDAAIANTPLAIGDRLQTAAGRAEVLLGDGSALHLDGHTTVDINGDSLVRLIEGRVIVLAQRTAAGTLQVDASPASVRVQSSAEVYLTMLSGEETPTLQIGVVRGYVDVETDAGSVSLQAGYQLVVREGGAPAYPTPFNSARIDDFVRWSNALTDSRRGAQSTSYLPGDVQMYGSTFDQYGSWSYYAPYGYVWYPRVKPWWRPYHHGRWRYGHGFGWTFVGYDPWGWVTHHYGRWGLSPAGGWFWIPKAGWGAAWVSWAVAPGYVSWCPLGYDNRPVRGFWAHRSPHHGGPYAEPWRAWSVVPTSSFRTGAPIHRNGVDPRTLAGSRGPAFVQQSTPPAIAVPRGSGSAVSSQIATGAVAIPRAEPPRRGPALPVPATASSTAGRRGFTSTPGVAPPAVIYHRGTPIDPARQSSGANPYERAGVAVPRGLPADAGSAGSLMTGPPSPYSGSTSPYSRRPEGESARPGEPGRAGTADHPDYAVPRSGGTPSPPTRPAPPQGRGDQGNAPAAGPRGDSPRGGSIASGTAPRSAPAPRGDAPSAGPRSAPPSGRSSSGSGSSTGTAVPRRR